MMTVISLTALLNFTKDCYEDWLQERIFNDCDFTDPRLLYWARALDQLPVMHYLCFQKDKDQPPSQVVCVLIEYDNHIDILVYHNRVYGYGWSNGALCDNKEEIVLFLQCSELLGLDSQDCDQIWEIVNNYQDIIRQSSDPKK